MEAGAILFLISLASIVQAVEANVHKKGPDAIFTLIITAFLTITPFVAVAFSKSGFLNETIGE